MPDTGRRSSARVKTKVKVRFKDMDAFVSEYTHNISRGGLFVRTKKPCAKGAMVELILVMPETGKEISAISEVIHAVSEEKATKALPNGMGLEIKEIDPADQDLIEDFVNKHLKVHEPKDGLGRRKHKRHETRVRVRFGSLEAMLEEYTHNISHGGIFIRTDKPKKLHENLKIILTHPETGEEILLDGEVVRVVKEEDAKSAGHPPGMGIKFLATDKYTRDQLEAFIKSHFNKSGQDLELEESD